MMILLKRVLFFSFLSVVTAPPTELTLEILYDKVKSLIEKHPAITTLTEIGQSAEKRPIYAVKLEKGTAEKTTLVVEFGIHARELASVASGLFLLEKLVGPCEVLLEKLRWYVIPVLNPDGYKYAVDKGELWRKNRARIPSSSCVGIDLNRNFAVGWENKTSSDHFCKEDYCGPAPLSEPESKTLKKFLDGVVQNEKLEAYVAVHTCATGMFFPYGYKPQTAANVDELKEVGRLMQTSIKEVAGNEYEVGPAYTLGVAGGGVDEWVYDTYHVPLVYTFELGPETWGENACFFPNATTTRVLVQECFAGLESLASYVGPYEDVNGQCGTPSEEDDQESDYSEDEDEDESNRSANSAVFLRPPKLFFTYMIATFVF